MYRFLLVFTSVLVFSTKQVCAQQYDNNNEIAQITETLMDYIEGSTGGQPERLKKPFIQI